MSIEDSIPTLERCPFCGRHATIVMYPGNWDVKPPQQEGGLYRTWYVGCSYTFFESLDSKLPCEITPSGGWYAKLEDAIKDWNRRK